MNERDIIWFHDTARLLNELHHEENEIRWKRKVAATTSIAMSIAVCVAKQCNLVDQQDATLLCAINFVWYAVHSIIVRASEVQNIRDDIEEVCQKLALEVSELHVQSQELPDELSLNDRNRIEQILHPSDTEKYTQYRNSIYERTQYVLSHAASILTGVIR
ncbi:MAG: hypothetical protein KC680_02960 [Candidatus Peregrinibacteria bacterium]|nr:hypothetical protein [Candidatus Peregrinibacteria bacterium]MCB9808611.1 hypothetical protein [Candidatus Peribacteria bacterium]